MARERAVFTSSSRRKMRKAHFTAPSHIRRIMMSAPLSKELRTKYNVRSLPVRKDDEVKIKSGSQKNRDGKVICCYRKRWAIHIDKITREKSNGATVYIGVHPSNVEITKLKMDKGRKAMLDRKNVSKTQDQLKQKAAGGADYIAMGEVD